MVASATRLTTPADAGFAMPAEWEPHAGCLMSWPSRRELWHGRLDDAARDYAIVARAIARFEPVVMVCSPGSADDVRRLCGPDVIPIEFPLNDSWARDNGPIFVRGNDGEIAVVSFRFNAWGERWSPYDDDAELGARLAEHFGLRLFRAPMVLEGGSFFVDGDGTVLVTEQCLLNPNRNPELTRAQIERGLCDYLGASAVVWLPFGHSLDVGPAGTDGHVDGVAQYVALGRVLLELPTDPASSEYERSRANLAALADAVDASGRAIEVLPLDPGGDSAVSYANHYLATGAVIVPVVGDESDEPAIAQLRSAYPDREVVGVPGATLAFGGGGPHCITQQIPLGVTIPGD